MSDGRRYFNLQGVVRDLEHARGSEATAEGRDLWARFCDLVDEASEVAEALDADDESEDEEWSDTGDDAGVGVPERSDGDPARRGSGGDAESIAEIRGELTRLASLLAAVHRPQGDVPTGVAPVDDAGAGVPGRSKRLTPQPKMEVKGGKVAKTKSRKK